VGGPPSRGGGGRVRGRAAGPALPDLVPGHHPGHDPARLPAAGRQGPRRRRPGPLDWALAGLALVSLLYPLVLDDSARRVVRPPSWTWSCWCWRRAGVPSAGSCRPSAWLRRLRHARRPAPFGWELGHKGYDLERLVGQTYMGIEGLFGVPRTWPPPASCCSPCRRPPWARPPTGGSRLTRGACGAVDNPVHPLPGSATLPLGAPPTGRWG
jgi:hypothetical protein